MASSTFQFQDTFFIPNEISHPLSFLSSSPQPSVTTNQPSVSTAYLFWIIHINKILYCDPLCLASPDYHRVSEAHLRCGAHHYFVALSGRMPFPCAGTPPSVYPFTPCWTGVAAASRMLRQCCCEHSCTSILCGDLLSLHSGRHLGEELLGHGSTILPLQFSGTLLQ